MVMMQVGNGVEVFSAADPRYTLHCQDLGSLTLHVKHDSWGLEPSRLYAVCGGANLADAYRSMYQLP